MRARKTLRICASYMEHVHDDWSEVVGRAEVALKGVRFNTMIGRGLSGSLLIPRLAAEFDCHWMIVRKNEDNAHAWKQVEGTLGTRWIFVDDLIDSGETLRKTLTAIENVAAENEHKTTFVGAYLYKDYYGTQPGFYGPRSKPVLKGVEYPC